jgi:hypothetical protein
MALHRDSPPVFRMGSPSVGQADRRARLAAREGARRDLPTIGMARATRTFGSGTPPTLVQRLSPEPRPAPNAEPCLQGLVFSSILPGRPEEQATHKNSGQEEQKTDDDRSCGVHQAQSSRSGLGPLRLNGNDFSTLLARACRTSATVPRRVDPHGPLLMTQPGAARGGAMRSTSRRRVRESAPKRASRARLGQRSGRPPRSRSAKRSTESGWCDRASVPSATRGWRRRPGAFAPQESGRRLQRSREQ